MIPHTRLALLPTPLAAWLVLTTVLTAAPPEVKDDAAFFTPASVTKANDEIKDIKQIWKKDLQIESFKGVPAGELNRFNTLSDAGKRKFFADWAAARAKANTIEGIYILLCKQPGHLEVEVSDETSKKGFPVADRDKLRDLLLARFKAKEFDKGLAETVDFVRGRFEANLPRPTAPIALNEVKDQAGFFSPEAVARANKEIKEFKQQFGKDLVIETFNTVPADKVKHVEGLTGEAKSKFFANWVRERSQAGKLDGIHVLICRQPPHIQVGESEETAKSAFTTADRDRLVTLLVSRFKEKEYDQGLLDGLRLVEETLDRSVGAPLPAPVLGEVKDGAGFFTPGAIEKANQAVRELKEKRKLDLLIETFKGVPPGKARQVAAMNPAERNQFFAHWERERAQAAKMEGIHILICKDPAHIQIGVGNETAKTAFTLADRDAVRKELAARFTAKQYDEGLADAVSSIGERLQSNVLALNKPAPSVPPVIEPKPGPKDTLTPEPKPAPKEGDKAGIAKAAPAAPPSSKSSFDITWVFWGILILLGLWVFIGVVRALFGSGKPPTQVSAPPTSQTAPPSMPAPPARPGYQASPGYAANPGYQTGPGYPPAPPPAQSSGGGFFPGLLGGMFGAAAGSWLYDSYFRRSSSPSTNWPTSSAYPSQPSYQPAPPASPGYQSSPTAPSSTGGGYTSSGGDFGEDRPAEKGYTSSSGDFGSQPEEQQANSSSGGDFGEQPADQDAPSGSGGDFGSQPEPTQSGSGGDFGGGSVDDIAEATGGGDSGSTGSDDSSSQPSGGGDF